jgi:ribosomal protein L16 Arg81 hydroxylase
VLGGRQIGILSMLNQTMDTSRLRLLSLSDLLDPISSTAFLEEYLGQQMLHIPGRPDKFEHLLSWSVLSEILTYGQIQPGRFRLMRNGELIPFESYVKSEDRRSFQIPHLSATHLGQHLREGATLILDSIDHFYAPICFLTQRLERALNRHVQANMYAGWRESPGLNLHWDRHDAFILQVSGRKHWQLYGETRRFPLEPDISPCEEPESGPIWQGMLSAGDVLYIPRGCWHIATPCDEPTLHLTVGFKAPSGSDMTHWLADQLKCHEVMRKDLPVSASRAKMLAHFSEIRDAIVAACMDEELLDRFLADLELKAKPRSVIQLSLVMSEDLPSSEASLICMMTPRHVRAQSMGDGQATIRFDDKSVMFLEEALPVLEYLESVAPVSIREFYERFGDAFGLDVLREFLRDLAKQGIVAFEESNTSGLSN